MSDSSGEEGALQIDISGGGGDSVRGIYKKNAEKKSRKGWEPGDVVWAKVTGFNYWPAKVFDARNDPLVPDWLKQPPRPTYMLVRFFGTYDMQWVSSNSAETYEKGLKKKFHNKSRRKVFQKALKEARSFLEDGSLSEGMTIHPPDPVLEDEHQASEAAGSTLTTTQQAQDTPIETLSANNSTRTHTISTSQPPSGSRRRKGSTPRRLSSSSSIHSNEAGDNPPEVKKVKVGDSVQAFTCAPLPLSTEQK